MTTVEPLRSKKDIRKIERFLLKSEYRNFVLFKIGINLGLRISDLLALNVKDIKNKKFIRIQEQKTGKLRIIPINNEIQKIVNVYTTNRDEWEPLFISKISKQRLDRVSAYRIMCKACKDADVGENIGTHTLRKTFGYHYYKKYKDVVLLQKIFNHSSPSITLRYIGITQDEIYKSYINFNL